MSEIKLNQITEAFVKLGFLFENLVNNVSVRNDSNVDFEDLLSRVYQKNPWFTRENVLLAFSAWSENLKSDNISFWLAPYEVRLKPQGPSKVIGVINAGNIPLVGFHDLLSVLISGNKYIGKNSSSDPFLLPFVAEKLIEIEPKFKDRIVFSDKLSGFDAVIATGSNNSARYFEYYFGKYPHITRMNRNAIAVLTGGEVEADFKKIGNDIFQYFGLGCRNVSKLYVPRNYNFNNFFESMESFSAVAQHNKYMNNHDYNNAIYLLKKIPFLDNNFLILKEDEAIASPISVVYYEFYDDLKSLEKKLEEQKEMLQCIVSKTHFTTSSGLEKTRVGFGETQCPHLWDYADGVDTMDFLLKIQE